MSKYGVNSLKDGEKAVFFLLDVGGRSMAF